MKSESMANASQSHTSRRRFLRLAGGAIGVTALAGAGLVAGSAKPQVDARLADASYGEASNKNDRILVAYASHTGSTSGVAEAVGKQLAAAGLAVDVRPVIEVKDLSPYRAAVVGSAINGGKWLPEAMKFAEANQSQLSRMPTACFLVCLTMANDTEEQRARVATWMEPARSILAPVAEGLFGGQLWYKNYSLVGGLGMRIFAVTLGVGEGDYRDWDAVRAWADDTRPLLLR